MRSCSMRFKELEAAEALKVPTKNLDANAEPLLLKQKDNENSVTEVPPSDYIGDTENQIVRPHKLD